MAEVKLKKLFLVGTNKEKDAVLKRLAYFGAVEVKDAAFLLENEAVIAHSDLSDSHKYKAVLDDLSEIIGALTPFAPKKGLFTLKPNASETFFDNVLKNQSNSTDKGVDILKIIKERQTIPSEISRLESQITSLIPWLTVDLPLSTTSTQFVDVIYGMLPVDLTDSQICEKTDLLDLSIVPVSADNNGRYIMTYVYKGSSEECLEVLREFGFSRINLRGFTATPKEETAGIQKKIADLRSRDETLVKALKSKVPELPEYEVLFDALTNRLGMEEVKSKLLTSESAFYLTGFIPDALCDKLEKNLDKYYVALKFSTVGEDDDPPVLLHNNALVQPYEMVTELYSLPAPGGFDPNWIMAPFFFLFFGMMLADVGYGIIMVIIGMVALKKLKPEGFLKKLLGLVVQGGVATALCGVAFGSFFGDVIPVFSSTFLSKTIEFKGFINPIDEPITMLILCCGIGIFQILVGLFIKAYLMVKSGDALGALFDVGLWYVVFAGIGLFALKNPLGVYVLGGGALGLILTQGRSKKGIFSKLFSGVLSLYNITGYLSDVLSYSRLMALGIASAVISSVFNTMGTLAGKSVLGFALFVVVFLIGHTMNFAINILGSYVHSSRLQYVEFFGKFYESGGRAFNAFKVKGKYNNIV